MAERNFDRPQTLGREKVFLSGSFQPNGAGAVDNTQNKGAGFSVARTGVGAYTITLSDKYYDLDAITFGVRLNAAVATLVLVGGAVDVKGAKTIPITVMQESAGAFAAADIANNANAWITFRATLANSAVAG